MVNYEIVELTIHTMLQQLNLQIYRFSSKSLELYRLFCKQRIKRKSWLRYCLLFLNVKIYNSVTVFFLLVTEATCRRNFMEIWSACKICQATFKFGSSYANLDFENAHDSFHTLTTSFTQLTFVNSGHSV